MPTVDWRRLEQALADLLRAEGCDLDQHADSGDILAGSYIPIRNITQFAKDLAERLK